MAQTASVCGGGSATNETVVARPPRDLDSRRLQSDSVGIRIRRAEPAGQCHGERQKRTPARRTLGIVLNRNGPAADPSVTAAGARRLVGDSPPDSREVLN